MLQEIRSDQKVHLFWGGRTKASFKLYEDIVQKGAQTQQISSLHLAYSRESEQKVYVQDLLEEEEELVSRVLKSQGMLMICGSLAMENGVKEKLERITINLLQSDVYSFSHQIKSDCY